MGHSSDKDIHQATKTISIPNLGLNLDLNRSR